MDMRIGGTVRGRGDRQWRLVDELFGIFVLLVGVGILDATTMVFVYG